jgi:catalase
MPQSKQEAQRKSKAGEALAAKQKQLESFSQGPENILTTNQGVVVPDNHNSLRAGVRGPTLLEDFILREKLSHLGRERIPERVVNARGAGAHGYFELTKSLVEYTRAEFLQEAGSRTPVFVRFSTTVGSRGSADTARDVRGFAVKFYTREGNYDLVGSNMPVFFIQDAIKFPDLVHAWKPEPHHGMPQASSAHDTFWDFVSLMPETSHMLMWLMSDRALPRSWRMMDGFGVHTFRFVNAKGDSHFVKFHWRPKLGKHALLWDEAMKLAGRDPDFHRRDLWEAIEQGDFPEWELGVQLIDQSKADALGIDLLDPTKLVPEEIVPLTIVGRLVLNRNPDNHFAEAEQVAFHPGHVVPGIDFSNDPLLQGRLFAYTDAQLARLSGPNHHELPINRGICPFHNFQRDGANRMLLNKGAVAYEPNSLASGAEFRVDGGQQGFQNAAEALDDAPKVRRRSPTFDEHFAQARLFWNSQSPVEREHLVAAFQFELSKVQVPAIRQRVVDNLAHVDGKLARRVAEPLGIDPPDPKAAAGRAGFRETQVQLPVEAAPSLSMEHNGASIATRRVAVLVASGVEVGALRVVQQALQDAGARCEIIAANLGSVATAAGQQLPVERTFCTTSSVQYDAVLIPGGTSAQTLASQGDAVHFVMEAYRHCKTIGVIGEGVQLLRTLGVGADGQPAVPGVVLGRNDPPSRPQFAQEFLAALARHRHWSRTHLETVPA